MVQNNPKLGKGRYLEALLRAPCSVFTVSDAALLWGESNREVVTRRLKSYATAGQLYRAHHGIYAKDTNYFPLELAGKIYRPSYISFESVLTTAGITFQFYETLFVATYVGRELTADGHHVALIRLRDEILCNPAGIDTSGAVSIASPERALLDRLYVSRDYHFDNPQAVNWGKVKELLPLYRSRRLDRGVAALEREIKPETNSEL